jgi:putative ABC transport system permease protein
MFLTLLRRALTRRQGGRIMTAVTTALGATVATAMLSVVFDIADKVNAELQTYGANIVVQPQGQALVADLYDTTAVAQSAALSEADVPQVKAIFWAFNITGFTPLLRTSASVAPGDSEGSALVPVTGTWFDHELTLPTEETAQAGIRVLKPWWALAGDWPADDGAGALAGATLAAANGWAAGDTVEVRGEAGTVTVTLTGIVTTGEAEDDHLIVPLAVAQRLAGRPGEVDRIEVAALTTPENDLARRAARDPRSLTVSEWETWYCTAYASSIAYQLEEAIPGAAAKPVRQVTESQGSILTKTQAVMLLTTLLALAASALALANLVTASVMERSTEIGLLKAVGATDGAVVRLTLAELTAVGLAGGAVGYGLGLGAAQVIGLMVFDSTITPRPAVAALVTLGVAATVLAGSLPAVRLLLNLRPAQVLHGR